MQYPNLTVTNKKVVRVKEVKVTIPVESTDEEKIEFWTSNSHIIYLAINQHLLRKEYSYDEWEKNLFIAISLCKELTDIQKSQFDRWMTMFISFSFEYDEKVKKKEKDIFIYQKIEQLHDMRLGIKNNIIKDYEKIRDSQLQRLGHMIKENYKN